MEKCGGGVGGTFNTKDLNWYLSKQVEQCFVLSLVLMLANCWIHETHVPAIMIANILRSPTLYAIIICTIGHNLFMQGILLKYEFYLNWYGNIPSHSHNITSLQNELTPYPWIFFAYKHFLQKNSQTLPKIIFNFPTPRFHPAHNCKTKY